MTGILQSLRSLTISLVLGVGSPSKPSSPFKIRMRREQVCDFCVLRVDRLRSRLESFLPSRFQGSRIPALGFTVFPPPTALQEDRAVVL